MKNLFHAGRFLLLDMASTLFFLALYLSTDSILLSVALGVALGIAQIGWQFARKKPIETMEWLSLFLVVGSGAATLITNDPRFVLIGATPPRHTLRPDRRETWEFLMFARPLAEAQLQV